MKHDVELPPGPEMPAPGSGPANSQADLLLATLPCGMLLLSATGTVLHLNPQAATWWGVAPADAQGRLLTQVGPGSLPELLYDALRQVAAAESQPAGEYYLPGAGRWLAMTSQVLPVGIVVHWQDVTLQKQREQEYQALVENTPDALTRWGPDLRLRYANAALTAKVGVPLAALLGKTKAEMGVPETVAAPYMAALQRVFDTGQAQELSYALPTPQGTTYYHSRLVPERHDGRIETVLGIAHDITELQHTQAEALRLHGELAQRATDKYHALFQAMDQGFCVLEVQFDETGEQAVDLRYLEVNPVYQHESGLPVESQGRSARELLPGLEPFWYDTYGRVALTGEAVRLEHYVPQVNRWFYAHAFRVGPPAARQVAVLFSDVTARKQATETLRHAAEAETFQLHLADALGPLTEPKAMQEAVTRLAHLHFGADRCYYCEIDDAQAIIRHDAAAEGLPSVAGTYSLAGFVLLQAVIEAGRPFRVRDVREDAAVDAGLRELCRQLGAVSYLNVPVVKHGQAAGVLCLVQNTPRAWTDAEAFLAAEVAERTWAAVERGRAEQAVRASEEQFRAVANLVPDLLWRSTPDNETTWYNQRWHEYTGQTLDEAAGHGWVAAIHPEDRAESGRHYRAALADGQPLYQEHRIRSAAGEYRWFQVEARPLRNGHGEVTAWFGAATDIHARKQREQHQEFLLQLSDTLRAETGVAAVGNRAVQLLAEQLRVDRVYLVTLSAGDDAVVVTHETRRADLPPLQGAYRSSDFPAAIKEIFERTIVYDDVRTDARLTELDRLSFAGLSAAGFIAAPIRRGSEAMIWAAGAVSTQPRAWTAAEVSLFEDAIERIWAAVERARTEAALAASEVKYRTLFDSIDEGVTTVELLFNEAGQAVDLIYLDHNPALTRQTGMTSDVVGRHATEVAPDLEPSWYETYGQVVQTGEPARFENYSAELARWFDVYVSRVGGAGSHTLAIVYNDITARKRYAANLAFLAEVNQELAQLTDPDATMGALCEKIGRYFDAVVCALSPVDEAAGTVAVQYVWHQPGAVSPVGVYRLDEYHSAAVQQAMRAGQPEVVRDTTAGPPDVAAYLAALHIGAFVNLPFVRRGQWLFTLSLTSREPRDWRADELELLGEVTARIWTRLERARAEAALRRSELEFRSLVAATSDVVYKMSPDWSQMHQLLGKGFLADLPQASGSWLTGYIPAADQELVQAAIRAAIQAKVAFKLEHRVIQADGEVGWAYSRAVPLLDAQGNIAEWLGAAQDITARKLAEAQLRGFNAALEGQVAERTRAVRDSRDLLHAIAESQAAAISAFQAVRDAHGRLVDLKCVFVNSATGSQENQWPAVGQRWLDVFPERRDEAQLEGYRRVLETGERDDQEVFYQDGPLAGWFRHNVTPLGDGVLVVSEDITARKLAEQERLRTLYLLEQAEQVASMGSWDYEPTTGRLRWSAGMYRLFHQTPADPVELDRYRQAALPDDQAIAERLIGRLTAGTEAFEETLRLQLGGQVKTVRVRGVVLPGEPGQPRRVRGVDLDISDVQRLEAENLALRLGQQKDLLVAILQAQEAERNRLAETLHNGLGQVLYATKLQLSQLDVPALHAQPELNNARHHADHLLTEAITQARTLAHQLMPTTLSEHGLGYALRDICRGMSTPYLRFSCQVWLDEQVLSLALQTTLYRLAQELAHNIAKHSGASQATLEFELLPGWVSLRAEDNGRGFDSAATPWGLGLRLLHDAVSLLDGVMQLDSSPEYGTHIRLRIPIT